MTDYIITYAMTNKEMSLIAQFTNLTKHDV